MRVYVLQHAHSFENDLEDVKFIGVYSSKENARAAIIRLSQTPGFSETSDGFHIDVYQLDKDHWAEGYLSIKDEEENNRKKSEDENGRKRKKSVKKK